MSERLRMLELLRKSLSDGDGEDFLCAYLHDRLLTEGQGAQSFKDELEAIAAQAFGRSFDPETGTVFLGKRHLPAFKAAAKAARTLKFEVGRPKAVADPSEARAGKSDGDLYDPVSGIAPFAAFESALRRGRSQLAASIVRHLPSDRTGKAGGHCSTMLAKACAAGFLGSDCSGAAPVMDAMAERGWNLEVIEDGHRFPSEFLLMDLARVLAKTDSDIDSFNEWSIKPLARTLGRVAGYFRLLDERGERPVGEAFGVTLFDCAFLALHAKIGESEVFTALCRKHGNQGSSAASGRTVREVLLASDGAARCFAEEMKIDGLLSTLPVRAKSKSPRV